MGLRVNEPSMLSPSGIATAPTSECACASLVTSAADHAGSCGLTTNASFLVGPAQFSKPYELIAAANTLAPTRSAHPLIVNPWCGTKRYSSSSSAGGSTSTCG